MRRLLTDRVDRFGALGQAAADLARAELGALRTELEGNARRLGGVLLLFVVALFTVFWALGALVLSLVEVGALWLPRWGAALAVVAVLALIAAVLALLGRRRLSRLETPAATVRRRAEDSQDWWERRLGSAGSASGRHGAEAGRQPGGASPRADA